MLARFRVRCRRSEETLRLLDEKNDPVLRAFREAPEDDEPWGEEDEAALAEVEADRAAGIGPIPLEEIRRKHVAPPRLAPARR